MARISEPRYTWSAPHLRVLERGRAQEVRQPVYLEGALVEPSVGTYELTDVAGAVLVSGVITVVGDIATRNLTAEQLPDTLSLGEGYRETWTLTLEGVAVPYRRAVALALRALHPPVADGDLFAESPDLRDHLGSVVESYQDFLDQGWGDILRRLRQAGAWSQHVVEASDLYDLHLHLTLERVYRALFSRLSSPHYHELAGTHGGKADGFWKGLVLEWERLGTGQADAAGELTAPRPASVNRNSARHSHARLSPRF